MLSTTFRRFSTKTPVVSSTTVYTSEFFDHIRQQIYGDTKKVEKVVVNVVHEETSPVLLNRNVSTGYNALNHISKQLADDAVLIDVEPKHGGVYITSANEPLQEQSNVKKIDFGTHQFSNLLNEAYWRSCSLVTAAVLKESLNVQLDVTFPKIDVNSGFFSVEVEGLNGNALNTEELNSVNRVAKVFIKNAKDFEVLSIPPEFNSEVSSKYLVRVGSHVFPTESHVIRSTSQIGRFSIVQSKSSGFESISVGGVSLPFAQPTSSYSWSLIVKNALQKYQKST